MSRLAEQVAHQRAVDAEQAAVRAKTEALVVEAYKDDKSLRDIARTTELSHEQIRRILLRNGVQIRGRGRAPRPASTPES